MDQVVVVTYPKPIVIETRTLPQEGVPQGNVGLSYYYDGHLIARGVVAPDALEAIRSILLVPVSVALAATEDDDGNIDARVCLVLPVDPSAAREDEGEDAPWKSSVPTPPPEVDSSYGDSRERPQLALLPIGNVVRGARDRKHPEELARDTREMLENLMAGRAQDAVAKAIDDLLKSI